MNPLTSPGPGGLPPPPLSCLSRVGAAQACDLDGDNFGETALGWSLIEAGAYFRIRVDVSLNVASGR